MENILLITNRLLILTDLRILECDYFLLDTFRLHKESIVPLKYIPDIYSIEIVIYVDQLRFHNITYYNIRLQLFPLQLIF